MLEVDKLTVNNKNMIEVSLSGTIRVIVDDEMMKEIQIKSITREELSLKGLRLIIEPSSYMYEACPTENILTYFNARIVTN